MIRRVSFTALAIVVLGLFGALAFVPTALRSRQWSIPVRRVSLLIPLPGRSARSGWTLRLMPHACRWTNRSGGGYAVNTPFGIILREQYYSEP